MGDEFAFSLSVILGILLFSLATIGIFFWAVGVSIANRRYVRRILPKAVLVAIPPIVLIVLGGILPQVAAGLWDYVKLNLLLYIPAGFVFLLFYITAGVVYSAHNKIPLFPLVRGRIGKGDLFLYVGTSFVAGLAAIATSIYLFILTHPTPSPIVKQLSQVPSELMRVETPVDFAAVGAMLVGSAIVEELVYRMYLQNALEVVLSRFIRFAWLPAIVLTSLLWALGHVGTLQPAWVKVAQIFIAGIIFGVLARKKGVEASIIAHSVLNLSFPLLQGFIARG